MFYSTFKTGHKRGVAILLHNFVNFELVREGKIENKLTTLFCVYLPPQSDQSIMKKVLELISSESQGTLICAGDFNMVISGKLFLRSRNSRELILINFGFCTLR